MTIFYLNFVLYIGKVRRYGVGQRSPTFFIYIIYNFIMDYELIKLNTARNSLRYVIKAYQIKEIYIPYYICPAIRNAVYKEGCKVKYYHIDKNFYPIYKFPEEAFILYPDYFGVCSFIVDELSKKYNNLIIDNAHSFYSKPKGIASFNSLRKFFPILRNGSFLYAKRKIDIKPMKDDFKYKPEVLSYKDLCKNENILDLEDIKYISDSSIQIYESINIEEEKEARINKFNYWNKRLNGNIKLHEDEVPFSYPYIARSAKEADYLVNELEKEGIFIFRYWNNLPDKYVEKIFYTNLVSIPL